jgi:hypothetical protein
MLLLLILLLLLFLDRLCGLVVRVLGYRYGGPGSITGTTRKKVVDLERGPLSLVSILGFLDRPIDTFKSISLKDRFNIILSTLFKFPSVLLKIN